MSKTTAFLVIKADRSIRVAKKPRLQPDEVAIRVVLDFPASWGTVLPDPITIAVPDFAPDVTYDPSEGS